MTKILCYGDSNTWGYNPQNGSRFSEEVRWPEVFRRCLGDGFTVVEDGLNGRTLCAFGMEGDPLNGSEHLISVLGAHQRFDLVIFYLGINDLFTDPHISVESMAGEIETIIDNLGKFDPSTNLLVLSPLPVNVDREYQALYHEQIEKSFQLSAAAKDVVEQKGYSFLDSSQVISASRHDGVHIEAEEYIKLGLHLCMLVPDLFSNMADR